MQINFPELRKDSMLEVPVLERLQKLAATGEGGILDIGPYIGGSSVALASGHEGRRKHAIIEAGGTYPTHPHSPSDDIIADLKANMKRFGVEQFAQIFEGWSTDSRIFNAALDCIDRDIGLFFYDGDGRCDDQFAIFAKYMRPGCVIVLDDYVTLAGDKGDMVKPWVDRMVTGGVLIPEDVMDGTWFGRLGAVTASTFTGYRHSAGHAYLAPATDPKDGLLRVFEDGQPLGPAQVMHDDIRENGRGAFSHWVFDGTPYVMFSTSDNSDPNRNGRRYEFRRT